MEYIVTLEPSPDGETVGVAVGDVVGLGFVALGDALGDADGLAVPVALGDVLGDALGDALGLALGEGVGEGFGFLDVMRKGRVV